MEPSSLASIIGDALWAAVAIYTVNTAASLVKSSPSRAAPEKEEPTDIPEDLIALANQERETWAQEETLRAMRERYEVLGDWNLVRSAFGVGQRR
jgi:hypothetical protein